MGATTELERDQAYRQGAESMSDVPIIYVDPNKLDSSDPVAAGAELRAQLESQVPGSAAALQDRLQTAQNESLGVEGTTYPMSEAADLFKTSGPASLNKVVVNGQEYCVINEPASFIDEAHEMASAWSHGVEEKNIEGTDLDYNRYVGRHEGEHCNRPEVDDVEPDSSNETAQTLTEEARADASALDDERMRLEVKDLRSLAAGSKLYDEQSERIQDVDHATDILLDDDVPATKYHVNAAESFRDDMDNSVNKAIEDRTYPGLATNAEDAFQYEPDNYFAFADAGFAAEREALGEEYKANPSFEGAEKIVTSQLKSDYAHNFEDAHRRRNLGQDVPETDPPQHFAKEGMDEFYKIAADREEPYVRGEVCSSEATVTSESGLIMRQEPDQFSAEVVRGDDGKPARANFGDKLLVYGDEQSSLGGVWREAVNEDGRVGWVSENYLDVGPEVCEPANVNAAPSAIINSSPTP